MCEAEQKDRNRDLKGAEEEEEEEEEDGGGGGDGDRERQGAREENEGKTLPACCNKSGSGFELHRWITRIGLEL